MSAVAIPDEAAYYAAMTNCLDRYEPMARAAGRQDVLAFIGQFRDAIVGRAPVYKLNRWLGYIQGVLIEIGCTNVLAEREWSRPLFRPLDYPSDRSTRPADPAAPVAEAGDGDVAASLAHLNIGYLYGIADALEHTDFTRAGDIRQCLLQVVKGLSASAATLEAERARADAAEASLQKVLLEEQEHIKTMWEQKFRADDAEQRAADALARAEKAEGAGADDRRRLDWLETNRNAEISHESFEDDVWQIHFVNGNRNDREWTKRAEADTVRDAIDAAIRSAPPRDLSQGGQHG